MAAKLVIYDNQPNAPKPNRPLAPGACAVLVNNEGKVFLHKRIDSNVWALPGGQMKIGESVSQCCLREIKEETSLKAKIVKLVGLYTSPKIVFRFPDNGIFQSFVVAFLCQAQYGQVLLNKESRSYQWFNLKEIKKLKTLPFVKKIIADAFTKKQATFD